MKRGLWRHYPGIMLVVLMGILLLQPVAFPQPVGPAREVVVYSARIESLIKPMFDMFTAKTGIPVKYFTAGEKELFERLQSEGANTPADIFMTVDDGNLWIAENADLLQGFSSEVVDKNIPNHLRAKDNEWVGLSV
ncbi:MAG TPA: iron ABC transporter substrate-binding protein, partial [Candidatus Tectomicrobia bacterium]